MTRYLLACSLLFTLAGCPANVECVRAIRCVESCGGPVIQSGCAACPAGSFDDLVCSADSGVADAPTIVDAPTVDAPTVDAFVLADAPATVDAPSAPSEVIGRRCGPADGFALELGIFQRAGASCTGDPSARSLTFFIHDLGGATLPPTAGSTVNSTTASANGNASECPGGSPPCRISDTWSVTFDTYESDVSASGSYSITWSDGSSSTGDFDATWCGDGPLICG